MATRTKKLRLLNEVYDSIPAVACKGDCWHSCSVIIVQRFELENMERAAGRKLDVAEERYGGHVIVLETINGHCQLLVKGRCSIYQDRPLVCRLYGVAQGLPCPHGCPKIETLPDEHVGEMLRKIDKL